MHKYILVLCVVISAIVIDNFVGFKTSVSCQCKPEESLFTCTCQENTLHLSSNNSHKLTISKKTILIPKHVSVSKIQVIKVHGINLGTLSYIFPKTLLNNLIQFHVKGCNVEIIDPDAFEQISHIRELNMRGNALQTLGSNTFQILNNLTRIILTKNWIQQIPEGLFDNSLQLTEIYLDRNNISALPDGIFDSLTELQSLHLEHNIIKSLDNTLFINNFKLKELNIAFNKIEDLPRDLFKNSANIVQIHLNDNNIQTIPSNIFSNLKTLNVISIQNNSINQLKSAFYKNDELASVNLNNNELSFVPQNILEESINLKYLNLENNNLICNCSMKPFYKEIKKRQIIVIGRCYEPMEYRNISFNLLPDVVFACPPKIQDFTYKENATFIEFKCVIQSDLTPNITLFHQGNLIPEENIEINSISTTYLTSIIILNPSENNRGDYKCFVSNEKGTDKAKLYLIGHSTAEPYVTLEDWDSKEYIKKDSVLPSTPGNSNNPEVADKCKNKKEYICELYNKNVETLIWNFKLQHVPITHIIINLIRNASSVASSLIVHGQTPELSCELIDDDNKITNKTWNNNTAMKVSDTNFLELKFYIKANDPLRKYEHQRLNINCTKSCENDENCESETDSTEYLNNLTYYCEVRNILQTASIDTYTIFWILIIIIVLLTMLNAFFIIKTYRPYAKKVDRSENLPLVTVRSSSEVDEATILVESEDCQPLMVCLEKPHTDDKNENEYIMSEYAMQPFYAEECNNVVNESKPIVKPIPPFDEVDSKLYEGTIANDIDNSLVIDTVTNEDHDNHSEGMQREKDKFSSNEDVDQTTTSEFLTDIHSSHNHLIQVPNSDNKISEYSQTTNNDEIQHILPFDEVDLKLSEATISKDIDNSPIIDHQDNHFEDLPNGTDQFSSSKDVDQITTSKYLTDIVSQFDDLCQALNDDNDISEYPETTNNDEMQLIPPIDEVDYNLSEATVTKDIDNSQMIDTVTLDHHNSHSEDLQTGTDQFSLSEDVDQIKTSESLTDIISGFEDLCQVLNDEYAESTNNTDEIQEVGEHSGSTSGNITTIESSTTENVDETTKPNDVTDNKQNTDDLQENRRFSKRSLEKTDSKPVNLNKPTSEESEITHSDINDQRDLNQYHEIEEAINVITNQLFSARSASSYNSNTVAKRVETESIMGDTLETPQTTSERTNAHASQQSSSTIVSSTNYSERIVESFVIAKMSSSKDSLTQYK